MNTRSANVYIVDDDVPFGKSLKRLLNARGVNAEHFKSAQSFLDSIPSGQHGFAIIDIRMPDCDGFELMGRMRDMHYDMPVILITGQPQANSRDLALKKGALGFLQKPFSEESLLELITGYDKDNSN